jgi:Mn-dependent DtxR family transcriptional regulator
MFMQNISETAMMVMAIFKRNRVGKNGFITTYQLSDEKELMGISEADRREAINELLMEKFLSYKAGQLILTEKGYNYLDSENGKGIRG